MSEGERTYCVPQIEDDCDCSCHAHFFEEVVHVVPCCTTCPLCRNERVVSLARHRNHCPKLVEPLLGSKP